MASGMFCGQVASGNRLKKSGSMFPAAFYMSVFRPGKVKVCSVALQKDGQILCQGVQDRLELGSKVHLLVDESGAPLAIAHQTSSQEK